MAHAGSQPLLTLSGAQSESAEAPSYLTCQLARLPLSPQRCRRALARNTFFPPFPQPPLHVRKKGPALIAGCFVVAWQQQPYAIDRPADHSGNVYLSPLKLGPILRGGVVVKVQWCAVGRWSFCALCTDPLWWLVKSILPKNNTAFGWKMNSLLDHNIDYKGNIYGYAGYNGIIV